MDLEKKYDAMTIYECESADTFYGSWIEEFEQAKASGDDMNVIQMIPKTKAPYCLWKILQYLKEIAPLEESSDPLEHWRGFLARLNMQFCRGEMRANAANASDDDLFL